MEIFEVYCITNASTGCIHSGCHRLSHGKSDVHLSAHSWTRVFIAGISAIYSSGHRISSSSTFTRTPTKGPWLSGHYGRSLANLHSPLCMLWPRRREEVLEGQMSPVEVRCDHPSTTKHNWFRWRHGNMQPNGVLWTHWTQDKWLTRWNKLGHTATQCEYIVRTVAVVTGKSVNNAFHILCNMHYLIWKTRNNKGEWGDEHFVNKIICAQKNVIESEPSSICLTHRKRKLRWRK